MYEYLPIKQAKIGDVVECIADGITAFTRGKLYVLTSNYMNIHDSLLVLQDDKGLKNNGFGRGSQCRLVKTLPGEQAKEVYQSVHRPRHQNQDASSKNVP